MCEERIFRALKGLKGQAERHSFASFWSLRPRFTPLGLCSFPGGGGAVQLHDALLAPLHCPPLPNRERGAQCAATSSAICGFRVLWGFRF